MARAQATVVSVNIGVPRPNPAKSFGVTGIDKRRVEGRATIRPPGPRGSGAGSGLVGDRNFDVVHHGGDDRAVYAYSREDLDAWQSELGRSLPNGVFGENITTAGLDITGALLGEQWSVGDDVVLEVTGPRVPCGTFVYWMPERGWMKRFVERCVPGAYLRVVAPGEVGAGDTITVSYQPHHDVTVAVAFKAMMAGPVALARRVLALDHLTTDVRDRIERQGNSAAVGGGHGSRGRR
jgi:MOSC domain-containing protein YiiM